MRLKKRLVTMTILALLCVVFPASMAENGEIAIDMDVSVAVDNEAVTDDVPVILEGLEDNLLTDDAGETVVAPAAPNADSDFAIDGSGVLTRYLGSEKNVVIPDGVKAIGSGAFMDDGALESVTIPASVTSIDKDAFSGSRALVICGAAGSCAERFAVGEGLPFNAPIVSIDEEVYGIGDDIQGIVVYINQKQKLSAAQRPASLGRTLVWSTSDANVATVKQDGTVTGISPGMAVISVNTADGQGRTAQITVVVPEPTSLAIDDDWVREDYVIALGSISTVDVVKNTPYSYETKIDMPVTWSTSDSAVISIEVIDDRTVRLKGNRLGRAVITATTPDGGRASVEMEVAHPEADDVRIDQVGPIHLYPGDKYPLAVTLEPAEAEAKLLWKSSDKSVVRVDEAGVITAVKAGWAYITVETGSGDNDDIEVDVLVPPRKITLQKTRATLGVGEKVRLRVTIKPEAAETGVTWKSSNIKIARVDRNGRVKARKVGRAVISVRTDNGKIAKAIINVKAAPSQVTLDRSGTVKLAEGSYFKLNATLPKNTASTLTWKSNRPGIVSVDQDGVLTAKKKGTAYVFVRTYNGKFDRVRVKVL